MSSDADEPLWKRKIRQVLAENGDNERAVSLGAGRNVTWIRDVLKRESTPKATSLEGLAKFCGRPVSWFFREGDGGGDVVPIVGHVRAGPDEIEYAGGQGPFGMAPLPPGAPGTTVAVVVRGGSMAGRAEEGDLVYFDRREQSPTDDMIGKLCVVGLSDGRVVIKKMRRSNGSWLLLSTSADPLIVDTVAWAAPVAWIKPK